MPVNLQVVSSCRNIFGLSPIAASPGIAAEGRLMKKGWTVRPYRKYCTYSHPILPTPSCVCPLASLFLAAQGFRIQGLSFTGKL